VRVIRDFVVGGKDELSVESLFEEVRVQQVTKGFGNELRMYVVVAALFPDGSLDGKGVAEKQAYLKGFIESGKLPFSTWIWGFHAYLAMHPRAVKTWPMTLKGLYDADLAQEDDIIHYYRGAHSSPVFLSAQQAAQPFLTWLETVEESSSDSSG